MPEQNNTKTRRVIALSSLGVAFEYYDFIVYGLLLPFIMPLFFDESNGVASTLKAFSVFALGYMARPLGSLIFGQFADRKGRKAAFTSAMFFMAFATLGIGMLPTVQTIGVLAPILLVLCRMVQGISFGAEMPSAITIVSEQKNKTKRGFFCGLVISGASLGSIMATAILALLTWYMPKTAIIEFGWRIPFIWGGCLAFISWYLRRSINETDDFIDIKDQQKEKKVWQPLCDIFSNHLSTLLLGICITLYPVALVITNIYFASFFVSVYAFEAANVYNALTIAMIASVVFVPIVGWISDQIKRQWIYLSGCAVFVVSSCFLVHFLDNNTHAGLVIFLVIWQAFNAASMSIIMPWLTELFPTTVRASGVGLCYNTAFVICSFLPSLYTYIGMCEKADINTIFYILSVLSIIGGVCAYGVMRRQCK